MNTEEKNGLKMLEQVIHKYNLSHSTDDFNNVMQSIIDYCVGDYDNIYVSIAAPDNADKEIKYEVRNNFNVYQFNDLEYFDILGIQLDDGFCVPVFTSEYYENKNNTNSLMEISFYNLLRMIKEYENKYLGIIINPEFEDNNGCVLGQSAIEHVLSSISDFMKEYDQTNVGIDAIVKKDSFEKDDIVLDGNGEGLLDSLSRNNDNNTNKKIYIDFSNKNLDIDDPNLAILINKIFKVYDNRNQFVLIGKDAHDKEILDIIANDLMEIDNKQHHNIIKDNYF